MSQTQIVPARRGRLGAWSQIAAVLVAAAGLGLALYQQVSRANVPPARWDQLDRGFALTEKRLEWLNNSFGESEEEIKAFRESFDHIASLSESVDREIKETESELRRTEKRMRGLLDSAEKEIESLSGKIKVLELGISHITQVYDDKPPEDRRKIDFTVVDGVVTLPNRPAGSVRLRDTTIRRSGSYIVISCLLVSPNKNLRIKFHNGRNPSSVTAADGTTIRIESSNIGKTNWVGMRFQNSLDLHMGVPVSVQWKLAVPEHHVHFTLIELILGVEGVDETISYREVAVP